MSCTISVEKRSAVLTAKDGQRYYALFEATLDTSLDRKDPRWGCLYFGTGEACMQKVVRWSSAAEGGSLKGPKGNITPSAYIKHWLEALATPVELQTLDVSAPVTDKSIYAIEEKHRIQIAGILQANDVAFVGDNVSLHLPDHAAVLQQILDQCDIGGWRFIQPPPFHRYYPLPTVPEAGYAPPKAPGVPLPYRLFSVERKERFSDGLCYFSQSEDGVIVPVGEEYVAVQSLISIVAIPGEANVPGSAENTIRGIRKAIKEATPLSPQQIAVVYRDPAASRWHAQLFNEFAAKLGRPPESKVIITTIGEILAAETFYEFHSLGAGFTFLPKAAVMTPKPAPQSLLDLAAPTAPERPLAPTPEVTCMGTASGAPVLRRLRPLGMR